MTKRQADLCLIEAFALGWEATIAECLTRKRYKVVLERAEGSGSVRLCAWTWADWRTIAAEEAQRDLPF